MQHQLTFQDQLVMLVATVIAIDVMLWGTSIMFQGISPRFARWIMRMLVWGPWRWLGALLSINSQRLLRWVLTQLQNLLLWMLRQLWRFVRWGFRSLRTSIAGLLA